MFYYQFRRRHDYPLINDDFGSNLPRILTTCCFVFDRKNIDSLKTSIRTASDIWFLVKTAKFGDFLVDRNSIDLYYTIGGFVVDRKNIDSLTTSMRKASEMRSA